MKRSNKKGFTIVELVIVIAVIAILASVLIPTIAGLVRDANISADTVLAKELNRVLAQEVAKDDDADKNFEAVIATLQKNGYYIANLNARADECYFVWDNASKQILLVDGRENYKVLYSNKAYDAEKVTDNWYFAISDAILAAEVEADGYIVKHTIANATDLTNVLALDGERTIYLDNSVVINSNSTLTLNNKDADITIDLGASNLTTDGTIKGIPVNALSGSLTIKGGVINGNGEFENENGKFSTAAGAEPGGTLTIDGTTIYADRNAVSGPNKVDGTLTVIVNDAKLYSGCICVQIANFDFNVDAATATLTNVVAESTCPIFSTYNSIIYIKSGSYVSTGPEATLNNTEQVFYVDQGGQVIITGGTFTCKGVTMTFDALCEAGEEAWENISCAGANATITEIDGVKTVIITK